MLKFIKFITFLYLGILIIFCGSPYWPERFWWIANVFQVAPLWVLYIPLCMVAAISFFLRIWKMVLIQVLSFLVIFIGIMGFEFSFQPLKGKIKRSDSNSIRIVSANLGERADFKTFLNIVSNINPDVLVLQEVDSSHRNIIHRMFSSDKWRMSFNGHLAVISRLNIISTEFKDRRFLGGWGPMAGRYELESPFGIICLFNVHFKTPRKGIDPLMEKGIAGIKKTKEVTSLQEMESSIISQWASSSRNVWVAGDFNMREKNPIYRRYWSNFSNAFSKAGFGFGYTKYTSWHGARIDHVLYDSNWKVRNVAVGQDFKGDHRPLIVDLDFIGESDDSLIVKKDEAVKQVDLEGKDYFVFERFESSVGNFVSSGAGKLSVDYAISYLHGNTLKIKSKPMPDSTGAGIKFNLWALNDYKIVSFSYRIPAHVPVGLRVKTRFNDWIYLGGTPASQCTDIKSKNLIRLIDDDKWHEIEIDVKSLVGSVLPALKYLKEIQFYIHENRYEGDKFWIDDFRIMSE